jgi:hypothetical protein
MAEKGKKLRESWKWFQSLPFGSKCTTLSFPPPERWASAPILKKPKNFRTLFRFLRISHKGRILQKKSLFSKISRVTLQINSRSENQSNDTTCNLGIMLWSYYRILWKISLFVHNVGSLWPWGYFCCNTDVLMMSYHRSDDDKMRCLEDAYRYITYWRVHILPRPSCRQRATHACWTNKFASKRKSDI